MTHQGSFIISGGWLGTYYYRGRYAFQPPVRFEGTFSALDAQNRFTGTILDDSTIGEATATGAQHGPEVRFTKVYIQSAPGYVTAPIEYTGTMSDDGQVVTGEWRIETRGLRMRGVWEAHRLWQEEVEATAEVEDLVASV